MGKIHKGSAWQKARAQCLAGADTCMICGRPLDFTFTGRHPLAPSADHIIPVSRGGDPYAQANLRPAHYGCNSRRGNRTNYIATSTTHPQLVVTAAAANRPASATLQRLVGFSHRSQERQ